MKNTLYEFVKRFEIDILIVENALLHPDARAAGRALTHFITETGIPTIAHHHDFYWERTRFSVNAINDILDMAFPPTSTAIQHVTINTLAQEQLAMRKGDSSILIPNVLDFEQPPPARTPTPPNSATTWARLPRRHHLQPTRVVPRKDRALDRADGAARRSPLQTDRFCTSRATKEASTCKTCRKWPSRRASTCVSCTRTSPRPAPSTPKAPLLHAGRRLFPRRISSPTPSLYEGFGNALLEAFYYRKPVLVNRYAIFISDIEPKGFRTITMDGFPRADVVQQVRHVIADPDFRREMVDHNYELCKAFFSYTVLRRRLRVLITNITGMENL